MKTPQQKFGLYSHFCITGEKHKPTHYELTDRFGSIVASGNYALCNFVKMSKPYSERKFYKIKGKL